MTFEMRGPQVSRLARACSFLLFAIVALLAVNLYAGVGSAALEEDLHFYGYAAVGLTAALLSLSRAYFTTDGRLGWLLFGLGVGALAAGDLYWTIAFAGTEEQPFPNFSDTLYLASYPLMAAGLIAMLRRRIENVPKSMWLDAAIAILVVASVGAGLILPLLGDYATGTTLQVVVAAAYPIGDVALIALIAVVVALSGARLDRVMALVMLGIGSIALADAVWFYGEATGDYVDGGLVDLLWPLGMALLALAAWTKPPHTRIVPTSGMRALVVPSAFALVGVTYDLVASRPFAAELLGSLALILLVVRMVVGLHENRMLVQRLGIDPLTGLGNSGRLGADLTRALAAGREKTLVLADLDGFKLYNDSFGHPAGDAMLTRLGGELAEAAAPGKAYRVGGDEFCVLLDGRSDAHEEALSEIKAALTERGRGFYVTASLGTADVPDEAHNPEAALHLADQRMYANKDDRRRAAQHREALTVLINAQRAREPELDDHVHGVANLAAQVGKSLKLEPGEVTLLRRAAELHDIGKIAIPDAILDKPEPLSDEEQAFMRQHTILGERILEGADSLAPIARIVRSTHERMDGKGYPDGLEGQDIPLAARIVFACDAFHAMTSDRPYSSAMSEEDAIAELRRCAGTQFDPIVVEALVGVLAARLEGLSETVSVSRPPQAPAGVLLPAGETL